MQRVDVFFLKATGSAIKIAKTKENLKNVDIRASQSKGQTTAWKCTKIPKKNFCFFFCYLIHGYIQSQTDFH